MSIEQILTYKEIILQSQSADIQGFILKNQHKFLPEIVRTIAEQIQARQKAKNKLPTWYAQDGIVFPAPLSVEQASSESTASYKSSLVKGKYLLDMTGGMGVDAYHFAQSCESVIYVEQNKDLTEIVKHNNAEFGLQNIDCFCANGIDFLENTKLFFDWIYLDPARRDSRKNKVFLLNDCEPNILIIKELMFKKAKKILLKTSPLLDISLAINQLENVSEVHVVGLENEVKELLFVMEKTEKPIKIVTINITKKGNQTFDFFMQDENKMTVNYAQPKRYIYEPNASIMKSGAFRSIAQYFKIEKIAPNSHLYTSDMLLENFVGRSFTCLHSCKFDKKEILAKLTNKKANVSVRNFPLGAEEVRKKLGLQDGGELYLFATENLNKEKIILICQKV